jgi:hypothetical protein
VTISVEFGGHLSTNIGIQGGNSVYTRQKVCNQAIL